MTGTLVIKLLPDGNILKIKMVIKINDITKQNVFFIPGPLQITSEFETRQYKFLSIE